MGHQRVSPTVMMAMGSRASSAVALPAKTLVTAFTTPATRARSVLINDCIQRLIIANVWSTMDVMWMPAAADSQAAGLNWKNPAVATLTAVNSPTFTADRGYSGNGTTSYEDTNWNPTVSAVQYTQNSSFAGGWCVTNAQSANFIFGQNTCRLSPRGATDLFAGRCQTTSSTTGAVTNTTIGHKAYLRNNSANYSTWSNGAVVDASITSGSLALVSNNFFISGSNLGSLAGATSRQMALVHIGGAITTTQIGQAYTAFLTYLQGVGAA